MFHGSFHRFYFTVILSIPVAATWDHFGPRRYTIKSTLGAAGMEKLKKEKKFTLNRIPGLEIVSGTPM